MQFPTPTGPYQVGTTTFTITDTTRLEKVGPRANQENRKIPVRLYYPITQELSKGCQNAPILSRAGFKGMAKEFFIKMDYEKRMRTGENISPFFEDAPMIQDQRFPLLMFNHGYISYVEGNSGLCGEIASHGYLIASVGHNYEGLVTSLDANTHVYFDKTLRKKMNHPLIPSILCLQKLSKMKGTPKECYQEFLKFQDRYSLFMSERLKEWAIDTTCALEEVKKRYSEQIDFSNGIAASGHSIGGCTAYYLCQNNTEFSCGLNIDGGIFGNYEGMTMTKPFFQISTEPNINAETRVMFDKTMPCYHAIFKNLKHIAFADIKYFMDSPAMTGKMPAKVMHETLCACHLSFLDKYLKNKEIQVEIPESEMITFSVL